VITSLVLALIEGAAKIAVGAYEDSQKNELERLAALQEWFQKGAEALGDLAAAHAQNVDAVQAAFAAARARLSVQALGARFVAALGADETTKP
jgi:hypothetical protein